MAGGRARVGLGDCPMIQPDHDVPAVLTAGRDACRMVLVVQGDQGAGGIERQSGHLFRGNAGVPARLAHRLGDRGPDVLRTLLGVVGHRSVERDRALRTSQHPTIRAEHTRACTARPDVDRD